MSIISYEAKDIYVLEGLEPVRKRPEMYIGTIDTAGLHHLIWEVFDNSIDEAMAGYAKISRLNYWRITGLLLPMMVGEYRLIFIRKQKSALETVMCTLHAGGKFGGGIL